MRLPDPSTSMGLGPETRLKEGLQAAFDFWEAMQTSGPSYRKTQKRVLSELIEVYGPRKLIRDIDREELVKLVKVYQARGVEVYHFLRFVKKFMELMRQEGVINLNPVQYRRLPFTIRPYATKPIITLEQYQRLLAYASKPHVQDGYAVLIMIGWATGLRCCDAATIKWDYSEESSYVDLANEIIIARPSKKRRSKERLEIPITAELLEALRGMYAERESDFVTPSLAYYFRPNTSSGPFRVKFKAICQACDLPEVSYHCFRHSFVTRLLRAGVNPVVIASLTGQSLAMIQRYSRVSREDKVQALDAIRNANHNERLRSMGYQPPL